MDDRLSLRRRAALASHRSLGRTRVSEQPRGRTDTARVRQIEAAILSMPPITREVFILHRFDELRYERIARRLGISVEEVTAHMAAAILQLDLALRDLT